MILTENEFLCMEGDTGRTMYIVKNGLLEGTSTKSSIVNSYGPGSIIGEFSLLEAATAKESIKALENTEVLAVDYDTLQQTLSNEPSWLNSIVTFLTGRFHIAESNKRKSDMVRALPALLYLLNASFAESGSDTTTLSATCYELQCLFNIPDDEILELLNSLQSLDVLKIQNNEIRVESPRVIGLLYETITFRALHKKPSPNILSMTEQMVLTVLTKAVKESHEPLRNGTCVVSTESMKSIAKKSMHGMTLTMRTLQPLIDRGLINADKPGVSSEEGDPLDSIRFFYGDFEKILDLMELNRIYPLLDKKLVGND